MQLEVGVVYKINSFSFWHPCMHNYVSTSVGLLDHFPHWLYSGYDMGMRAGHYFIYAIMPECACFNQYSTCCNEQWVIIHC